MLAFWCRRPSDTWGFQVPRDTGPGDSVCAYERGNAYARERLSIPAPGNAVTISGSRLVVMITSTQPRLTNSTKA